MPATIGAVVDADTRRQELERRAAEWASCERCALAGSRTQVVVGSGEPDADLMFVGEAPGFHEDKQGIPFVGQAGRLLETLLEEIGQILAISSRTVKFHQLNVLQKLGAESRQDLLRLLL